VQLDAIYDMRGNQGSDVTVGTAPLAGTAADKRRNVTSFQATTSRLNFRTSTPIADANLATFTEFDFYGGVGTKTFSNSFHPRLRHAYGEYGPWLAGQTWSTFMDPASLPETLEFNGPLGEAFVRQPQLRFTTAAGPGKFALSAESPESDASRPATGGDAASNNGSAPPTAARVRAGA